MADRDELRPSEAARRIGATTRSVQRWIAAGRLPARRVGGRWRVASDALDAFATGLVGPIGRPVAGSPIRTLFVANRGEIARRIARTCRRLGIAAVVPPSDGPDALDLLDIGAVVAAATLTGADAVHPGFGFLAENATFAETVEAAGMRWVGPPPAAIRAMGDKAAARRLAARLGVPTIPGYDAPDQTDAALRRAARRIGYPVLVKPAAGGGGKGMRVVRDPAALGPALDAARREASAAFGDDRLILERFLDGPRHVEVQILFDGHSGGVHLGERDCSVQRRHQKVLEETPAPQLDPVVAARLQDWSLALARAVGYVSAGTCEFLVTDAGEAFFLEMNTRLQVEHPVTEAVTGRDLVADQLTLAAGAALAELGLTQAAVDEARAARGHAIEVRLYAEDARSGFLPATGRIERLRWPAGDGIRIDAGVDEGTEVGGRFDPMLAKIVAHGRDRAEALGRLSGALDATVVLGLTTNLEFLRWVVRRPEVVEGRVRIDLLGRAWPPADLPAPAPEPSAVAAAAGLLVGHAGTWTGGWRLNGPAIVRILVDGTPRTVAAMAGASGGSVVASDLVHVGDVVHVDAGGRSVEIRLAPPPDVDRAARAAASHHGGGPVEVEAPMPGAVLKVHAARGATVEAGDPLVTLEAMKMEHLVAAPIPGTIAELSVRVGDQVTRGTVLAVVEP